MANEPLTADQKTIKLGNRRLLELADYVERRQRTKPRLGYYQAMYYNVDVEGHCGSPSCMVGHGAIKHGPMTTRSAQTSEAYWRFVSCNDASSGTSRSTYALSRGEWVELFDSNGCDNAGKDWRKAVAYVRKFVARRGGV